MPINKAGKFTWQKQYSAWEVIESQRNFHRAKTQEYLNSGSDALSSIQTAFNNQITGTGDLIAKAALKRIQTATALAADAAKGIDISA
jgi:hypothetical protein